MEQGPGVVPPEEMSLRPFWSIVEILGVIAVIAPFVITVSSSSMSTVNGHVTQFVFRDWVAVGGGALGAICGLGAATRFRTTMKSQRALRWAVVIGLLGLGTLQILRGFGITQPKPDSGPDQVDPMNDPMIREAIANAQKHMPDPAATKPPIDLAGPTATFIELWQGKKSHELYGHLSPAFQATITEDAFAMMLTQLEAAIGPCKPTAAPATFKAENEIWAATAELTCGKLTAHANLDFKIENAAALLQAFHVELVPRIKADHADATKLVRGLLDDLLVAKIDHFGDVFDPRLLKNLGDPAAAQPQLAKIAAESGKIGAIREVSSTADNEFQHSYVYDVAAEKQHLKATFTASFTLARWFVIDFNLAPADEKKP